MFRLSTSNGVKPMSIDPLPNDLSLFERLRRDPEILALVEQSDGVLSTLGYTDHGRRHVTLVAVNAAKVLTTLRHDARWRDLAAVAGLLHDIGNVEGREGHAAAGAAMAYRLLLTHGVAHEDAQDVSNAVASHDENEGGAPVNPAAAALIIADKADIHRSRVRTRNIEDFDVHDRVNFAVTKADLRVHPEARRIGLGLSVDPRVASGADIAELFALRFDHSQTAAQFLGCTYHVKIGGEIVR